MRTFFSLFFILPFTITLAQNQKPMVTVTDFQLNLNSKKLTIYFTLNDPENDSTTVTFLYSENGGQSFTKFATDSLNGTQPLINGNYKAVWLYQNTVTNITQTIVRLVTNDNKYQSICQLANQVDTNRIKNLMAVYEGPRNYNENITRISNLKDSIENTLTNENLSVSRINFSSGSNEGENIIGLKKGMFENNKTVIIDAHFDADFGSPGADDNASGLMAVFETARLLRNMQFENNIEFIAFDLEELGLLGSINYAANLPAHKEILGVVNLEMIGFYSNQPNSQTLPTGFGSLFPTQTAAIIADSSRGNFITNVYNTGSAGLGATFSLISNNCLPNLKVISLEVPGNGSLAPDLRRSDHAPFWDKNIPALMITDGANFRNPYYHTPNDKSVHLNYTFMQQVIGAALLTVLQNAKPIHGTKTDINLQFSNVNSHQHQLNGLKVFPNPTKNELNFNLNNHFGPKILIEIYDLKGAKQLEFFKPNKAENNIINVQSLHSGTYVILISDGIHQETATFKFEK